MKITETHIYFWNGIYSNWHPAQFTDPDTNIRFFNSEQCFMWYKAKAFGDTASQGFIERETNPKQVKELGRQVKGYNDAVWAGERYNIMVRVNMWKFTQNEDLLKELLATGSKTMVEASPYDKVWGVGLLEDDPLILDKENWEGQNLLGIALMEVRDRIRKENG